MERHECFFVKTRDIGQKKTGKSCFLQMRLCLLYKVLVRFRHGGKSGKKHFPRLICCEDKKQVAVMFWGCVSSRGEEALIPVLSTIDSVKYIDIFLNYLILS